MWQLARALLAISDLYFFFFFLVYVYQMIPLGKSDPSAHTTIGELTHLIYAVGLILIQKQILVRSVRSTNRKINTSLSLTRIVRVW